VTSPTERPLRADARRNRARVLEVAREVFAAEGLAVPIDEIASRAGVGIGTVYRHFPTKEALFEAIVLQRIEVLTEEARAAAGAGDPTEEFFAFFTRMIEMGTVNKALIAGLVADRGAVIAASRELHDVLGNLLVRAQQAGGVRTDVSVADLKALMIGALAMERQGGSGPAGSMVAIVCDGLRAR
jgi:AcrR family transcriptional regulator